MMRDPAAREVAFQAVSLHVEVEGRVILNGVSLEVARGEVVLLKGKNGVGKSTLLRACSGITPVSKGSVWIAGCDVTSGSMLVRQQAGLAYVPQGGRVFAHLTVVEHLRIGARSGTDIPSWLVERTSAMGNRLGRLLSGGERQILALAAALATRPAVLLLDEPLASLALETAGRVLEALRAVAEKQGTAVLLAEHNVQQASEAVHRVIELSGGCLREDPNTHPAHRRVLHFPKSD